MSHAYIIGDVTVTNPEQMAAYRVWSTKAMEEFGAEVLVRGGEIAVLEGDWHPTRLVILKFPSMEQAKAMHASETYTHARKLRENAGVMRMLVVDGI
ncbi:MAG: hypothetical protein RIR79_293 [Pseudomonadota bacterium]|jgi:uncharacterized protein (DUF1330 family)